MWSSKTRYATWYLRYVRPWVLVLVLVIGWDLREDGGREGEWTVLVWTRPALNSPH